MKVLFLNDLLPAVDRKVTSLLVCNCIRPLLTRTSSLRQKKVFSEDGVVDGLYSDSGPVLLEQIP